MRGERHGTAGRSASVAAIAVSALVACGGEPRPDAGAAHPGAAQRGRTASDQEGPPLPEGFPDIDPMVAERIIQVQPQFAAHPGDAAPWVELGLIYQANWYSQLAESCYERAADLDGSNPRASYFLAIARDNRGDPRAIDAMERAAGIEPTFAPAHWRLGLMYLDSGRVQEAERCFLRATDADLTDPAGWFGLARVLLLQKRAEEAARIIELRLLHGPYAAYARHMLAEVDRQLGRSEPRRTEHGPAVAPPWRDRWSDEIVMRRTGFHPKRLEAEMLAHMGRYDEAIERLQELLVHWPDNMEVRNDLAMVHFRSGHADEAKAMLDAILEASPNHPATLANRAVLRLESATSRGALALALADADHALRANPNYAAAHEARGNILFKMLDFERAADAFRAAVRCDARRSDLLVEAGRAQVAQRRFDKAAVAFQEAIDRAAALDQAWLGLGIARMELGDAPGAAAALDQAAQLIRPGDPAYAVLQQRMVMLDRSGGAAAPGKAEGRE